MAIATSMEPKKNIDVVIDTNGLRHFFQNITMNNEVSRGKGFPDIYLLAASRLSVDPAECVVFEDILAAIRGAKAGGFQTVAIFDELSEADWPDMQKEATVAASSWKDLL